MGASLFSVRRARAQMFELSSPSESPPAPPSQPSRPPNASSSFITHRHGMRTGRGQFQSVSRSARARSLGTLRRASSSDLDVDFDFDIDSDDSADGAYSGDGAPGGGAALRHHLDAAAVAGGVLEHAERDGRKFQQRRLGDREQKRGRNAPWNIVRIYMYAWTIPCLCATIRNR